MKLAILDPDSNIFLSNLPLNLPVVKQISEEFEGYLIMQNNSLGLSIPQIAKNVFTIDFESGKLAFRALKAAAQRELIVRACQVKNLQEPITILDATAGLGRDSFILALSGAQITLVEQNSIVAALLQDGLRRIQDFELRDRLRLIHANSCDVMENINEANKPDVIYLDPMFEEERNAKVKKDLQILQALLASDKNTLEHNLLSLALNKAKHKVVVKRAIHAPNLEKIKPSYTLKGKHSRFDIYVA